MTPEQLQQFEEMKTFIESLKNSASITHDVDAAFRDRLLGDLVNAPESAITAPTGGSTVDAQARTAVDSIITALETLGLLQEN